MPDTDDSSRPTTGHGSAHQPSLWHLQENVFWKGQKTPHRQRRRREKKSMSKSKHQGLMKVGEEVPRMLVQIPLQPVESTIIEQAFPCNP